MSMEAIWLSDLSAEYMTHLRDLMIKIGLTELLFTSDGLRHMEADYYPEISGVLKTANFQRNETIYLERLQKLQPDKPLMVTEFWPGWFDHWSEPHHEMEVDTVVTRVSNILKVGASINFYMFHGGTNFGFMNGGNALEHEFKYQPTVTSYDYDAPLSEAGDITKKFKALKELMKKYNPDAKEPIPFKDQHERTTYEDVEMQHALLLGDFVPFFGPPVETQKIMPMEELPINNNGGQGYGFIMYQTELDRVPKEIIIRKVSDRAQADGKKVQLDILVENMGRINYLPEINRQRKGILGDVEVDGEKPTKWNIYPMEFKHEFFEKLKSQAEWRKITEGSLPSVPSLYRGTFTIDDKPKDTFLYMKGWTKGVVFINGHNLGRYWDLGPQETLYLPSPWLRKGDNELLVFELHKCESPSLSFVTEPKIIGAPIYRL